MPGAGRFLFFNLRSRSAFCSPTLWITRLRRSRAGGGCLAWQCSRRDFWFGNVFLAGKPAMAVAQRAARDRASHAGAHSRNTGRRRGVAGNRAVRHESAGERAPFGSVRSSLRPALVVGIGLAIFQQITGINTVIYYAPLIIQSAGISSASGAILATAGIGVVNVLMTIFSMWLIDRKGRRPLLLTGIAGMAITLGLAGVRVPHVQPIGRAGMACGDQHDGVRRFVCDQPRADFLAPDFGNLSVEDPQFGGRTGGNIQLGSEPAGYPDIFNPGGTAGAELRRFGSTDCARSPPESSRIISSRKQKGARSKRSKSSGTREIWRTARGKNIKKLLFFKLLSSYVCPDLLSRGS